MAEFLGIGGTIVAIATAIVPQQGSVGIVRMSGSEAQSIAKQLFYSPGRQTWESHRILYGYIRHPQTQKTIDEALLLLMLSPRSYTREDVVEFHCHGGIIAVQQVLQLCIELGARLAQPGEFTLRAFLNGRLDLTQAESVAELVGSQSIAAAQTALAGLQGKLANPIRELRATCLDILAEIEARVDFEEDLPPLNESEIIAQIHQVLGELSQFLATADTGELLRTGLKVAIVGRPNVGKSSLLNAWSRSDRAIVTDLPGTTRDVVESQLVVGGIPIQVLDTAGIRHSEDQVEKIGIERSHQAAQSADLVLFTLDAVVGLTEADLEIYQQVKHRHFIVIINKIDRVKSEELEELKQTIIDSLMIENIEIVSMSAGFNQGIPDLEIAILNSVYGENIQAANLEFAINQRQAAALTRAKICLEQVETTINDQLPFDFWTIDLRGAIHALGEVTGEEVTESVLDRIFSRFCIGK
ncbi:tRNA uridine-5-carboxymethylaminomethyl(34) synthesis GTPase MnmE [Planktothrix agardhii]|jgi:tRNA modification GTPase|uniref:tRNA uridine-5-carboxymethylaminomethyl(34) synthesis GTPase MnmE n=1 Tax=Planktothrix agardhii TaxID=1160 RepID=UPI000DBB75EC|nr:tRNA uridine-5-carboxymethylaminomethyl(34) synthesis GTPase MnmE [Planktothrix agardhii]MCB8761138.1 tRNA uridine-5-carboxymethylaminomethyl(34) synthesis GTPase MnmE [Planktothrix agardhii 1813]MCF3646716.1 tRNA uridine-5-carboxymethylaminomethyl(34) synthesis GTPase MnmE [Planktothrix agardhii 1026]MEA5561117.1 tRNA uridine-5-carboxymethylaminomethyl(34) synthesis GTPase MnmE [Planktothrix agardhii UHCC 0887]BBD54977.1 tRNA modification GTPase [Planktothrix agardhii NIES-204]